MKSIMSVTYLTRGAVDNSAATATDTTGHTPTRMMPRDDRWRVWVGRSTGSWIAAQLGAPRTAMAFRSHAAAIAYADKMARTS